MHALSHTVLPHWDLRANGTRAVTGGVIGRQSFHTALLLHLKKLLCAQHSNWRPQ